MFTVRGASLACLAYQRRRSYYTTAGESQAALADRTRNCWRSPLSRRRCLAAVVALSRIVTNEALHVQAMSAQSDRRKANEKGSFYSIKTSFNTIFTHQPLADQFEKAVQLLTPIVLQGNLLANLHILRHLESGNPAILKIDQTFFYRCFAAVSFATGFRAQQFNPASDPDLAASLDVYQQSVPPGYMKPERPTWLKGVSFIPLSALLSMLLQLSALTADQYWCTATWCTSTSGIVSNFDQPQLTCSYGLQVVNEAAQMAHTNFKNHIVTNFRPWTMRWFRCQYEQDPYLLICLITSSGPGSTCCTALPHNQPTTYGIYYSSTAASASHPIM